jgi:SAM-dependent methyltransferase
MARLAAPPPTGAVGSGEPVAPRWQRKLLRKIPWSVRRFFDPHHFPRYRFVCDAARHVTAGARVVDAGAGECPYRDLFGHANYLPLDNALGDPSWDYSRIAVVGDLLAPPFRPHSVDYVVCNDVLEHVPDPQRMIDALFGILRPGGMLFLSAPQGWGEHQRPHDYFRFTSGGLRLLLERAGFRVESIRPLGGFFYYLANRLQMVPLILFGQRRGAWRIALLPFEFLAHLVFGLLLPLVLLPLDRFDREKLTTLTYGCIAVKPARPAP